MNNDKFKLGLALAREQALIKRIEALEAAVAPLVADFMEYDMARFEPVTDTFHHPSSGQEVENGVTVKVRNLRHLSGIFGVRAPQKYDDTLLPFLALMRKELHANSDKGDREGWLGMSADTAFQEVRHHYFKLGRALAASDAERIKEHAADVANCALMVADVCGVLGRA